MEFSFRNPQISKKAVAGIKDLATQIDRPLILMHVCGTHQDTLVRHGIDSMLSDINIDVREGPGCPVCVTTTQEIEETLALARAKKTICLFGDMLRTPGMTSSLDIARGEGMPVKVVVSATEALKYAKEHPDRDVVFLGVGFETTMPSTSAVLLSDPPENFSVLSFHRFTPPAVVGIAELGNVNLDGVIVPGHVSVITGYHPWDSIADSAGLPSVIAGFEPLDMIMGIYMILRQIKNGEHKLENEYTRAVSADGNIQAKEAIERTFDTVTRTWRGFPALKDSAAEVKSDFAEHNARLVYEDILAPLNDMEFSDPPGCRCGEVIRGELHSWECPLFGKICTPDHAVGPCMVSVEGACAIEYKYGGYKTKNSEE